MSIWKALVRTAADVGRATAESASNAPRPAARGRGRGKKKPPCTPCAAKARAVAAMNSARGV